jgi:ABC-type transporter lipoprotein component MlaA/pimeloyl-ACP methyl ester carboxylesterase
LLSVKTQFLILSVLWLVGISGTSRAATNSSAVSVTNTNEIILPEPIPDPLEKVNRGLWAVNEEAMKAVIQPSGKVYRTVIPQPFRIGISNVGKNLQYPRRFVNSLLQERWTGARDESYRFLCNSVLGMGGFLDIASELNIPLSNADFGQTLGRWGWNQNFYVMIPLAGPSSDRDVVGAAADSAVNPLSYFSPYSYIPLGIRYNDLTDAVDSYVRQSDSQMDPYSLLRYVSAIQRKERPVEWQLKGEQDAASLETLQTVLFGVRDPHFPNRVCNDKVKLSSTGRELPYSVWLQAKRAPIIYMLPGIGAHRFNSGAMGLAELLYNRGFSVVIISSAFNYEFIAKGLTADLPGYAVSDVKDIHVALTQIDRKLQKEHPGKLGRRGLMGYSMGGFHTLLLAETAPRDRSLLQFDRYLAIDSPVRLLHGIEQLDSFYQAALEWPAAERTDRIEQLFFKVAALARGNAAAAGNIPLNSIESRFVIGLAFRLNLRDVIFFTQMRHNQGVLLQPIDKWKREPVYREIMNYSFADYLNKFIGPYYLKRGIDLQNDDTVRPAVDLRFAESFYKAAPTVRLVENEDDILLAPEDVQWLAQTFGNRVTLFPHGGHLGNLGDTAVQVAIVNALTDLLETPVRRDVISAVARLR